MITDQLQVSDTDVRQKLPQPSSVETLSDTRRSFIPPPIETLPDVNVDTEEEKAGPGEVNIHLTFKFSCSSSFKILIGVGLCLSLAWNIYSNERRPAPPVPPAVPAPVPPAPQTPPRGLG